MIFKRKRFKTFALLFAGIVCGLVLFLNRAFSYNDTKTHPSLTANIAEIYNSNSERKLTNREIGWLRQGSIEEDKAPRWLNHFYNSQTNQGLWNFPTAENWSQNPALQSVYLEPISGGNQTWQKAISSFAESDEKAAFVALGHVLHLLEDMTVPAHTRLDAHPDGDPYERWVVESIESSINFNTKPEAVFNLNAAFDNLANYSGINFLSKDTIDKSIFDGKKTVFKKVGFNEEIECIEGVVENNHFCLIKVKNIKGAKEYSLDNSVHSDYFSLLAPKAVAYGAGVVKLFFEEAEKAKQEYEQKSWLQKLKEKASDFLANLSGVLYAGLTPNVLDNEVEQEGTNLPNETSLTLPSPVSLPPNTVIAQEGTIVSSPSVSPSESPADEITEEIAPAEIPSEITEDITDNLQAPASPSPSSSPPTTPPPSILPTGDSDSGQSSSGSDAVSDTTSPETSIGQQPPDPTSSSTAVFIFASSEMGGKFYCQLDNATTTDCISPQEYTDLSEGNHDFKVFAEDAAGNQDQTPAEYSWTVDLPPEVDANLTDYSLAKLDFSVAWNSSSTDVSYFDVQYRIGDADWQNWAMATTTTSKLFEATFDNVIFYFRVRAVDQNGFSSVWQEVEAPVSQKPIIFNEIMYDPSPGDDAYYEYIEIYNRSPVAVDLANWQYIAGGSTHILSADIIHDGSDTVLASGGYALITDKTTSTSTASIYDGLYYAPPLPSETALRLKIDDASLDLNNSGNVDLILKNASGAISDEVTYKSTWGAKNNGCSLERINYRNIYSQNQLAWQESIIGGTPNLPNSVLDLSTGTLVPDNTKINRNTIWSKAGSPYLLFSNSGAYPIVNADVKLIIEPGVVLKPQNKYYYALYVKGTLLAQGTEVEKISITSKEETPLSGDWGTGIYFDPHSTGSELSYVNFEYGGFQPPWPNPDQPAIIIDGASVDFNHCAFNNIQTRTLDLLSSGSSISQSQFIGTSSIAIYISGIGSPEINGNVFQSSGYQSIGLKIDNSAAPDIRNNTFSGFYQPVWLQSAYPSFVGNSLADNFFNGVYVDDQTVISQNTSWTNNLVYLLESNSGQFPLVATSTTLIFEPGTTIKPLNPFYTALKIEGELLADGNSSSTLINFTSFKDDSSGGDSNNDAAATAPDAVLGDWKNIVFASGSQTTLRYVRFQYGGYDAVARDKDKTLEIEIGATVTQENISLE